jgi:hypothetical protein
MKILKKTQHQAASPFVKKKDAVSITIAII